MSTQAELIALLADLRSLVQQAHVKSEEHPLPSAFPHYWNGVKVGYEDAADRLETLLWTPHIL